MPDETTLPELESIPEARVAAIGGTHMNDAFFEFAPLRGWFCVDTPEGKSPRIYYGNYEGCPFYYVDFHGHGQWLPTWLALKQLGVREAITGATAGGVNRCMRVGDYVIPDDFLDFNIDRPAGIPAQYLDNPSHVFCRFTPPMDEPLRHILIDETRRQVRARDDLRDINIHPVGSVVQSRAGRFETPAEIQATAGRGGDLVTLNVATEIIYARQCGIHLACLNLISNPAEGMGEWDWEVIRGTYLRMNPLSVSIVLETLKKAAQIDSNIPRTMDTLREHPELSYRAVKADINPEA